MVLFIPLAISSPDISSVDCRQTISLAYKISLSIVQPKIMNQLLANCCLASGITCSQTGVTKINWSSLGLYAVADETNPLPNIDTPYPAMLINLDLSNNLISASFPNSLPDTLELLNLSNNSFYGQIPTLPTKLQTFDISYNNFAGELPLLSNIKNLYLGINYHDQLNRESNFFTGLILVHKPTNFFIFNTGVSVVDITDTSALVGCDLSKNPLKYADVKHLTMCTMDNLYFDVNSENPEKSNLQVGYVLISVSAFLTIIFALVCLQRRKKSGSRFKILSEF